MTEEKQSWRERAAAGDQARFDAQFGMGLMPDPRQETPARLAWEAHQRGDQFFQIDLPISYTQGNTAASVTAYSRTVRPAVTADYLGEIEAQGWRLEHVALAHQLQGVTEAGNLQNAYHGQTVALYVFRRRDPA